MILLNPGFLETAYLDNLNSASTILNSPIGHNGIVEEPNTLKDDIASIFEVGFSHSSVAPHVGQPFERLYFRFGSAIGSTSMMDLSDNIIR